MHGSLGFEQTFQAALVLGGEQSDDGAGLRLVGKIAQRSGDAAHETAIRVVEGVAELGRNRQLRVSIAHVAERPARELLHELASKFGMRRGFGSVEHHHDRVAVGQAVVE